MKRLKLLIIGGLLALISLPALASSGNPRIPSSTPGAGAAFVFSGDRPYQDDDTAPSATLNLLTAPANYFIDPAAYPGSTKYGVTSTPGSPTTGHLLLKDGTTRYAVVPFTLGSPVGPADQEIPSGSITWYNTGIPDAPITPTASRGFETARIAWTLSPDFEYTSVELTVTRSDGVVILAAGGVSPSVLDGRPTSYSLGELIDGRVLTTNTQYTVSLVGVVRGKADDSVVYRSAPATVSFTTLSGADALSAVTQTWNLVRPTTGINTIAVPFNASRGITNADGSVTVVASGGNLTINAIVAEINRQAIAAGAPGNVATVFGWYNEVNQSHVGITSIADGTVTGAANAAAVLNEPIVQDRPYQVSVSAPVTFTLRGFRQ